MDVEDSVLAAAGSKDGAAGGAADAEGLAMDAALLFQGRRFAECAQVLSKLLLVKRDDPKVLHNIAVVEYFRDGCSDPKRLLDMLNKVKEQSEALARASVEQIEAGSSVGNSTVSGHKGNAVLDQFASFTTGIIVYANEFDTSVAILNIAVILYHLHEYAHALSILKPLYQNIEPIDETTALHVCVLLLDISLACQDAAIAADVMKYLEKSFGVGQAPNQGDGSTMQHQSNHGSKVPGTNNSSIPDASGPDSSGSTNAPENSLSITLSDETLEYKTLYSSLDTGSQNLGKPASNDSSKLLADPMASSFDLKLNLHLYKVQLLLLTRNLKAAKREIKLAMNVARFGDSSSALLLKSQLEYARQNHRKAIKLLMTSNDRSEPGMQSMFNNNMGCIYHQLGKHHTSNLFFSKALKISSSLCLEKPSKLFMFSQDKSPVIAYNCGVQNLVCGNPLAAARCFNKARVIFCERPIIWLRFAECCLLALEKGLLQPTGSSSGSTEVKIHVVGSCRWRHLAIDDINSTHVYQDCLGEDGLVTSDGQYRLSLPFARRCLLNAFHLLTRIEVTGCFTSMLRKDDDYSQTRSSGVNDLTNKNTLADDSTFSTISSSTPSNSNGDSKENKEGVSLHTTAQSSLSAYEDICRKEQNMIKQAVLGALAYVELSLGNSVRALSAAKALQHLPDCSRIYLFLSHMYAAEALCLLNRPKEALEHLSFYVSDKNETQFPYTEEDREKWRTDQAIETDEPNGPAKVSVEHSQNMVLLKSEEARGVLYANLATMYAIQGNLEQASWLVKEAMSALPDNSRVMLTATYVDLLLGRSHDALVRLRQSRRVRFFPYAVSSSCS